MADNIFEALRARILESDGLLPAERKAMLWFKNYSTELSSWQQEYRGKITHGKLKSRTEAFSKMIVAPGRARPGRFYFFLYSPAGYKTLPYYDRFPFVLVLDTSPGHILGLNFHYLNNLHRARLFDALYTRARRLPSATSTDPNIPLNSYIDVDYDLLTSMRKFVAFRPCIRSYRTKQMRTTLLQVGESEWDTALFLPVEMFRKASRQAVWSDSRKKIRTR